MKKIFEDRRSTDDCRKHMLSLHRRFRDVDSAEVVRGPVGANVFQCAHYHSVLVLKSGLVVYQEGIEESLAKNYLFTRVSVFEDSKSGPFGEKRDFMLDLEHELLSCEDVVPILQVGSDPKGNSGVYLIDKKIVLSQQLRRSGVECTLTHLFPEELVHPEGRYLPTAKGPLSNRVYRDLHF